jgi:hypothetical protein
MIATGVGGTSRIVTSSVVKVFCMSLLLALSRGPKAACHGSQSGDFRNDEGDCPNRCRKARAVDVIQHPLHPGMVVLKRRLHRSVLRGSTN